MLKYSDGSNLLRQLKNWLRTEDNGTYQKWKEEEFDINHRFVCDPLDPLSYQISELLRDELTLLHIAAEYSNEKVVQALLDVGADPTLEDKNGKTTDDIAQQEAKRELRGIVTEQAIKKAMKVGAICGVIDGLAVGGGCFAADAALPILALIGIAVAAAVLTGLVAGGITYKISKPSEKLDSVDAEQKLVQRQVL